MLNPMELEKVQGKNSRYALVMAIANRAREIANDPEYEEEIMTEKPVSISIEDFVEGKYVMVDPE